MFRRFALVAPSLAAIPVIMPSVTGKRFFVRRVVPHGDLYFPHIENLDLIAIRDVLGQSEVCDENSSCTTRGEADALRHVRDGAIASSVVLGVLMTEPEGTTAEQRKAAADVLDAAGKVVKTLDKESYDGDWREFLLLFLDRARTVAQASNDKQLDMVVQRVEMALPY